MCFCTAGRSGDPPLGFGLRHAIRRGGCYGVTSPESQGEGVRRGARRQKSAGGGESGGHFSATIGVGVGGRPEGRPLRMTDRRFFLRLRRSSIIGIFPGFPFLARSLMTSTPYSHNPLNDGFCPSLTDSITCIDLLVPICAFNHPPFHSFSRNFGPCWDWDLSHYHACLRWAPILCLSLPPK